MLAQSRYLFLAVLLTLGACSACSTFGGGNASTSDSVRAALDQTLVAATAALDLSTDLNESRKISLAQHKQVIAAADAVFAAVTSGRAVLKAGDTGGAQAQLLAVAVQAASLADFYLSHRGEQR